MTDYLWLLAVVEPKGADAGSVLCASGTRTGELGEGGFRGLEGLEEAEGGAEAEGAEAKPLVRWQPYQGGGVELVHNFSVKSVTWHTQGDYFATVAPTGNTQVNLCQCWNGPIVRVAVQL